MYTKRSRGRLIVAAYYLRSRSETKFSCIWALSGHQRTWFETENPGTNPQHSNVEIFPFPTIALIYSVALSEVACPATAVTVNNNAADRTLENMDAVKRMANFQARYDRIIYQDHAVTPGVILRECVVDRWSFWSWFQFLSHDKAQTGIQGSANNNETSGLTPTEHNASWLT